MSEITLQRIRESYGSMEEFLKEPKFPKKAGLPANFEGMRMVSKAEAEASLEKLLGWANSHRTPKGRGLGEWLFNNSQAVKMEPPDEINSLTPLAKQRNWLTPAKFPLCPAQYGESPILDYLANLRIGQVIASSKYSNSVIKEVRPCDGEVLISVICEFDGSAVKPWAVLKITVEGGAFCHESKGTFFD